MNSIASSNVTSNVTSNSDLTLEWKDAQEDMLRQYLATAESDLRAKQELADIKQQRLSLAQDEFNHLNNTLAGVAGVAGSSHMSASTTSCKFFKLFFSYICSMW